MDHRTSNDKMEKAVESIKEVDKHFNAALMWVTQAIDERANETDKVEKENELLRKQNERLNDVMAFMWLLNFGLYVIGLGAGWYVCS